VEYRLTDLGKSFLAPLTPLIEWAAANHQEIRRAREVFEAG
jgi:DNA-binding HxlR family transcriptional regulator